MDRRIFRDLCILIAVIVIAAIGARILAKGETLEDYASKNSSTAFASSETIESEKDIPPKVSEHVQNDNTAPETKPEETPPSSNDRTVYAEGFYYEPISDDVFKRIAGISYPTDCTVPLTDLKYVVLQYIDFEGNTQNGEMICGSSIAQDVVEIFYELYESGYQIQSIKLIDEFGGDDTASMLANNTSCFNYRVVEGTTRLSNHARGVAIDLNPFYNPYITYNNDGSVNISPEGSEAYADRSVAFPYKIDENDLAYKLFKEHGFSWGGNWNSVKDYQHFEKK